MNSSEQGTDSGGRGTDSGRPSAKGSGQGDTATVESPWRRSFYHGGQRTPVSAVLPDGPRTTLGQAFRVWAKAPSVMVGALAFLVALTARLVVGGYTWWDLAICLGLILVHPFTEWLIHVFILHARPITIGNRTWLSLTAREHVRHHADPKELETIFIPLPTALLMVTIPWLMLLIPGWSTSLVLTGLATAYAIMLVYEWTHYLIHTPYRPKGRYYTAIRKAHQLHHYRNENYWFGVTNHTADRVLHTYPEKDEVPASRTAKDLMARTRS